MGNSFSLYRLVLLIKRQWASFGKIFLIALGTVTLIMLGIYIYNLPTKDTISTFFYHDEDTRLATLKFPGVVFVVVGILFVTFSSSWYFSKWGKKTNALEEILLPASNLEKTICGIMLTSIVCIGSFLIVFFLVDGGYRLYFNAFVNHYLESSNMTVVQGEKGLKTGRYVDVGSFVELVGNTFFTWFLIIGFLLQSVFLLGSIYFNRFQYIKTAIVLLVSIFTTIYVVAKWTNYITDGKTRVFRTLQELEHQNGLDIGALCYVFAALFLLMAYRVTYLRVKEKEV